MSLVNNAAAAAFWFGLLALPSLGSAAPPQVDRVATAVDAGKRVSLGSALPAWASVAEDRGAVPADLPLTHLSLTLKRSPERQAAFEAFLAEQKDPSSPNYQRWLTPTEVGTEFGVSDHDIEAISGWLRSEGLSVDSVSSSRTRIRFSGNAAAVGNAFATQLRYYGDEKRIANTSSAEIPQALNGVVASVSGLHTVKFRSARHSGGTGTSMINPASPQPAGTHCDGTDCSYVVFPADFSAIYDLNPVYQQGIDGSGQTIAIVGRERVYTEDIRHYQTLIGQPVEFPTVIVPPTGTDPGNPATTCSDTGTPSCSHPSDEVLDQSEATLDVQRASSVAPGASIDLIVSSDTNSVDGVFISMDYAIDHDPVPAKILSISFTACEADSSSDAAESLDDFFAQAEAEGISVFVASGDAGVAGCASLDSAPTPGEPLSTNILCASGHVTCVGGTEFADAANPTAYWRSTNGAYYLSAIGYIPEGAWNDPLSSSGAPQLAATGGGVSSYIDKPSWQVGTGVPGNEGRYSPDVSFVASAREGYFTCFAAQGGPCTVAGGSFTFLISGGTSASAPDMAGVAALLNQKTGSAQANLNPRLYALAANPSNGVFHDVTVATSGVSGCTLDEPSLCNNSTPGPSGLQGGLAGFQVGTGYDEATGLGSIDVAKLLANWSGSSGTGINLNQRGLTGAWYNPATGGQGVVMEVAPDFYGTGQGLLFGGWFTYDVTAAGGQRWYSVQGTVSSTSSSVTMPIYISEGGNFSAPPAVGVASVGQATLAFTDCTHATMTFSFSDGSGRSGTIPLTRLLNNVACTTSGSGSSPPNDYYLSGTWYNPATAGQGFLFDINPEQQTLFIAWYTYATNGAAIGGPASQRWFSLQASFTPGISSLDNVPIYATTGGAFNSGTPTPTTTPVGTANLSFQSCNAATLAYTFDGGEDAGQTGTIPLSRLSPAASSCNL